MEADMVPHAGHKTTPESAGKRGSSGTGTRPKTVLTEVGAVDIEVPRDRDASFAPATVPKRVRRLRGVDEMVISLVARGMTTGDVQARTWPRCTARTSPASRSPTSPTRS